MKTDTVPQGDPNQNQHAMRRASDSGKSSSPNDSLMVPPPRPDATPRTPRNSLDSKVEMGLRPLEDVYAISRALKSFRSMSPGELRMMIRWHPNLIGDLKDTTALLEKARDESSGSQNTSHVSGAKDLSQTVPPVSKEETGDTKRPTKSGAVVARKPYNELIRLDYLRNLAILDTNIELLYNNILWLATNICETEMGAISLVDENRQWFKAKKGLSVSMTPREVAFCSHAILSPGEIFVVEDATKDTRFQNNPLVTGAPDIRFYAGMPLSFDVGFQTVVIGTVCAISSTAKKISKAQKIALRALGEVCCEILEQRNRDLDENMTYTDTDKDTDDNWSSLGEKLGVQNNYQSTAVLKRAVEARVRRSHPTPTPSSRRSSNMLRSKSKGVGSSLAPAGSKASQDCTEEEVVTSGSFAEEGKVGPSVTPSMSKSHIPPSATSTRYPESSMGPSTEQKQLKDGQGYTELKSDAKSHSKVFEI
ncbi:hypothetical protein AAMO2058_000444600 [Amorphochlora amoebiformis]